MTLDDSLEQIRQGIAERLGLPEDVNLEFVIARDPTEVHIRIPTPGRDTLDEKGGSDSTDIVGKGATLEEAFEDARSTYRRDATVFRVYPPQNAEGRYGKN